MKLLKVSLVGLFVFCSLLLGSTLHAATYTTENGKAVMLADVNVYEAKITSQKDNKINISFEIDNGQGVQPGVKYGVSLVKEETGVKQSIVDEYIYPEVLSLSSNSNIKKDITYLAPANISGNYSILISIKNESGMSMGMANVGKITLARTLKTIEIIPGTCFINVVGEKNNPKYVLNQGVDIEKTESLKLNCSVKNSSSDVISATPTYETHLRNIYGETVGQTGGDTTPISFKAGEEKIISLTLPKASKPQAYDVKVALKSNISTSNSIIAHYVLRGASAIIQNLSLDKDYYSKNDTANMSFIWYTSADSFPNSRLGLSAFPVITLTASIINDKKQECVSPINKVIEDSSKDGKMELTAPIIANCNNPQATITLKDDKGNILDQKLLSFESKKDNPEKTSPFGSTKIILIIFGVLVVAGLAFYFINLKKKENETINQ